MKDTEIEIFLRYKLQRGRRRHWHNCNRRARVRSAQYLQPKGWLRGAFFTPDGQRWNADLFRPLPSDRGYAIFHRVPRRTGVPDSVPLAEVLEDAVEKALAEAGSALSSRGLVARFRRKHSWEVDNKMVKAAIIAVQLRLDAAAAEEAKKLAAAADFNIEYTKTK